MRKDWWRKVYAVGSVRIVSNIDAIVEPRKTAEHAVTICQSNERED